MKNLIMKIKLKLIIKWLRKHFSSGISVVTDKEENIIFYRWAWTKELEEALKKSKKTH